MKEVKEGGKADKPTDKELKVSKKASIDFPVIVESLGKDSYHEDGEEFLMGQKKAKELESKGWVKIKSEPITDYKEIIKTAKKLSAALVFLLFCSFTSFAQVSVYAPLYNAKNTYSLANLQAATAVRDTVTDTGTGALYSKRTTGTGAVTIQVNVTEVSGTTAGTMTLSGSLDGVYYAPLLTRETQTAVATATITDTAGTKMYTWRLTDSPYLYYKIGTAGGTTCVYYLDGFIMKH